MKKNEKRTIKFIMLRLVIGALAIVLCAGATSAVCYGIVGLQNPSPRLYMEHFEELRRANKLAKNDVAIVPGAAVYEGTPTAQTADRLAAALTLYENQLVERIIVSGGDTEEVSVMARYLMKRDVPMEHLESDHFGVDTHETLARIADKHGTGITAYLCTQEIYANRSEYLMSSTGIQGEIVCVDTMFYSGQTKSAVREYFAATKAVFETTVYRGKPKTSIEEVDFITVPKVEKNDTHIDAKEQMIPSDYKIVDKDTTDNYDAKKAVAYAKKYALEANVEYALFGENCTNFVSQCLVAGGIEMSGADEVSDKKRLIIDGSKDTWYSLSKVSETTKRRHYNLSSTFINTTDFINYFTQHRGYELTRYDNVYEGKVACFNAMASGDVVILYNKEGEVVHIGLITGKSSSNAYFCANTSGRLDYSVFNINDSLYPMYGILHITSRN